MILMCFLPAFTSSAIAQHAIMSGKRTFDAFQGGSASKAGASTNPPSEASRPKVEERHTWTRGNQKLMFDHGKESEDLLTYHIPVRLPPISDGFRGFTYNVQGNLGIQGARPPFTLVGLVIEVTVLPFKCRNNNKFPHLEGEEFKLRTPMAKPVFGLLEDTTGQVHAIALSLIEPLTLIRGLGLSNKAFNLAGFPPEIGRRNSPAEDQVLVMGVQRHRPEFCPPGTAPIFRVGWSSSTSDQLWR